MSPHTQEGTFAALQPFKGVKQEQNGRKFVTELICKTSSRLLMNYQPRDSHHLLLFNYVLKSS